MERNFEYIRDEYPGWEDLPELLNQVQYLDEIDQLEVARALLERVFGTRRNVVFH